MPYRPNAVDGPHVLLPLLLQPHAQSGLTRGDRVGAATGLAPVALTAGRRYTVPVTFRLTTVSAIAMIGPLLCLTISGAEVSLAGHGIGPPMRICVRIPNILTDPSAVNTRGSSCQTVAMWTRWLRCDLEPLGSSSALAPPTQE